jgi:hypothetical protein
VELPPESRAGAVESLAVTSEADILAREPANDEVRSSEVMSAYLCDVVEPGNVGPVLLEHAEAVLVLLDLPEALEPRSVEGDIEAADPGEQ